MNYGEFAQLITTLGFPIVMCGAMSYYVKYITDKHREETSQLNEKHSEELKQITDALNNNTLALQHLCDTLKKWGVLYV